MPSIAPEQLSSIIRAQAGPLRLYALQFLVGLESSPADDVVQEGFVKLARQTPMPNDPTAWLYRVVRHAALAVRRGALRRRKHETDAAGERDAWFQPAADSRLDAGEAAAALAKLDEELRETVVAHLWGGLTFEQIGALSGTSSSTAHRRYEQGIRELREHWIRDDSFRWMEIPYAQAKIGLHEATQRLKRAAATKEEILPCATVLVSAVYQVRVTHGRGERRMDVLRLIEALRGYAARHDGRLPKTLDELSATTPVPSDAMTGKPLEYRIDAEGATLSLPEEFNGRDEPLVYEIRMAKAEDTQNGAAKK